MPNLITMPVQRQAICPNHPVELLLSTFPENKPVCSFHAVSQCFQLFLIIVAESWPTFLSLPVFSFFIPSSQCSRQTITLSNNLLTVFLLFQKSFQEMLKVLDFKVDVKYFPKSRCTLNCIQPSKKTQNKQTKRYVHTAASHLCEKTHCLLRVSNKLKWLNTVNKAFGTSKRRGMSGMRTPVPGVGLMYLQFQWKPFP